ncbi:mucin-3A [Pseudomyrmex gracilis]|uniref:mucin-3A n=1 Tax=Pseudomyrmex gracilis TaxID=219809 RepID=UPI000994F4AB|nr:mucin-3A [Pseudomyrmex gracilis]
MSKRSTELVSRWLLLAGLLCRASCQSVSSSFENKTGQNDSRPRIFSPKMDYDEWTPLGRGDPLKNSPTFDYVPPVLDRVQYWLDSQQQHTTEPSSKRDILVLGVTAKKTSPKIPEQFLKFVDGPKFTRTASQDPTLYRNDFTGSIGAEPPKLVRTTNFRNGLVDYRNQNRLQSLPASYYPNPYYSQKMKPYTMMMPPPMVQKAETSTSYGTGTSKDKVLGYDMSQPFSTQTEEGPILQDTQYYGVHLKDYEHYSPASSSRPYPTSKPSSDKIETIKSVYVPSASQSTKSRYEATTASTVSFEKSNLIYQSTQTLSGGWLGNNGPTSSSTEFSPDVNQVTWKTADYSKDHYEDHHAAASSNHEVVVGQNANIIVDGTNNENEEVVVGQKEISSETTSSTSENITQTSLASVTTADSVEQKEDEAVTDAESSQKMHIVVANSPSSIMDLETHKAKKGPVAVVMPTNYVEKNTTSSSDPSTTLHNNAWENPVTSEMTKTTHQTSKPQFQPMRNAVTSLPISTEEDRQSSSSVPNRIMPSPQLPHQSLSSSPMMPPRHIVNSPHMFLPPQAVSQYMLRTQNRPNHMMHLIGSMRPGFRPSSPISMFHMSPPMTQVHALPMKGVMSPNMEQIHQRPSQPFPVTFTSPPSPPTTLNAQATESDEHTSVDHTSRLPTTTANAMTTSSSLVSSSVESTSTMDTVDHQESTRHDHQLPLVKIFSTEKTTLVPSSTVPPRTTTAPSLTTDPIFSHYKQPAKPIRGPMYLIIQGHSKVKTYKPTINKHGVPVENNEIVESVTERQLSKLDQLIHENTKNGIVDLAAEKKKLEEKARAEKQRQLLQQESLMSLVESGLSGFTVSPSTKDEHRASKSSVTSIEIN